MTEENCINLQENLAKILKTIIEQNNFYKKISKTWCLRKCTYVYIIGC